MIESAPASEEDALIEELLADESVGEVRTFATKEEKREALYDMADRIEDAMSNVPQDLGWTRLMTFIHAFKNILNWLTGRTYSPKPEKEVTDEEMTKAERRTNFIVRMLNRHWPKKEV